MLCAGPGGALLRKAEQRAAARGRCAACGALTRCLAQDQRSPRCQASVTRFGVHYRAAGRGKRPEPLEGCRAEDALRLCASKTGGEFK